MEQEHIVKYDKPAAGKFSVGYGIALGMIMVVLSILSYVMGWALEGVQWPTYLYYLAFPAFVIYAINEYRKRNYGLLTLSDGLKVGVLIGVFSALVFVVYTFIFYYVIDPGFMEDLKMVARDKMLEQSPDMTPEMADQAMKVMSIFTNPAVSSAIWIAMSAIFGLLYGLIGGLIFKKENK